MKQIEAIRILDQHEAVTRLERAGFTRQTCPTCHGAKMFTREGDEMFEGIAKAQERRLCDDCEGFGWQWKAPAATEFSPPQPT